MARIGRLGAAANGAADLLDAERVVGFVRRGRFGKVERDPASLAASGISRRAAEIKNTRTATPLCRACGRTQRTVADSGSRENFRRYGEWSVAIDEWHRGISPSCDRNFAGFGYLSVFNFGRNVACDCGRRFVAR